MARRCNRNLHHPAHTPGAAIAISPIVGTINNWTYTYVLPDGTYTIGVSAPNFSPEHRTIELTSDTAEVFALAPDPGSASGRVVSTNRSENIRGAGEFEQTRAFCYKPNSQ